MTVALGRPGAAGWPNWWAPPARIWAAWVGEMNHEALLVALPDVAEALGEAEAQVATYGGGGKRGARRGGSRPCWWGEGGVCTWWRLGWGEWGSGEGGRGREPRWQRQGRTPQMKEMVLYCCRDDLFGAHQMSDAPARRPAILATATVITMPMTPPPPPRQASRHPLAALVNPPASPLCPLRTRFSALARSRSPRAAAPATPLHDETILNPWTCPGSRRSRRGARRGRPERCSASGAGGARSRGDRSP